jgi:antitoxin MazE
MVRRFEVLLPLRFNDGTEGNAPRARRAGEPVLRHLSRVGGALSRSYIVITGGAAVKTRIVPIGNSRGIRIPKVLLERTGLAGEVEISAEDDRLVIRPGRKPRAGWAVAFQKMAERGDDALLDEAPGLSDWDAGESVLGQVRAVD